jgi:GMP synthase (glutamine-hydrolysing)
MKRAIALRHVAFEDLGILASLLEARGYDISYLDAGVDPSASLRLDQDDLLVVLGGPLSAYEEDRYPFLLDELRLIERCLRGRVPVLGFCLGAQLMARALGVRVYPGTAKEIGFAPIELTAEGAASCLRHLQRAGNQVLHWHGDTFDLPAGATRLASTAITPNQAFNIGDRTLALQFHVEADLNRFERWLIGHTCELAIEKIEPAGLREQARQYQYDLTASGTAVLEEWLSRL